MSRAQHRRRAVDDWPEDGSSPPPPRGTFEAAVRALGEEAARRVYGVPLRREVVLIGRLRLGAVFAFARHEWTVRGRDDTFTHAERTDDAGRVCRVRLASGRDVMADPKDAP